MLSNTHQAALCLLCMQAVQYKAPADTHEAELSFVGVVDDAVVAALEVYDMGHLMPMHYHEDL
jgi:hypothetical protein